MIWQLDKCLALSTLTSMIVWHVLLPLVNCHIGKYHYIRPNNLAVLNKKKCVHDSRTLNCSISSQQAQNKDSSSYFLISNVSLYF